jgi:hypothetical protein
MDNQPEIREVQTTPIVLDPNSFTPRKGLITRYSRKLLEEGAKYYGRVGINALMNNPLWKPDNEPPPPTDWKQEGF